MKKLLLVVSLLLATSPVFALDLPVEVVAMQDMLFAKSGGPADWKVGDTLVYDMHIKPISLIFKTIKVILKITQIDKEGVNIAQEMSYSTYKLVIETLLDPETGKIKRTRINGKDQPMPAAGKASETRIINEVEDHIKVPAGEFDCIHLVTADGEGTESHAWLNPSAVPLSGIIKELDGSGIYDNRNGVIEFCIGPLIYSFNSFYFLVYRLGQKKVYRPKRVGP